MNRRSRTSRRATSGSASRGFESYRLLGYHIAEESLHAAAAPIDGVPPALPEVFAYLRELWTPLGAGEPEDQKRHAEAYASLVRRVYESEPAAIVDPVLFPNIAQEPAVKERPLIYMPSAVIDLMHMVFRDLHLDRFADRPHNAGWLRIFRTWANAPQVRDAWSRVSGSYSHRFRRFMESLQR